ncbi:MAG TPA: hypothetical protein PLA06_08945 [Syntrophorhabdaceae bacterium]|jgi:hypothetical protein|nr:hypothetical protein [Pseudomonadota bacterium]HQP52288.1 hypothetical protein [Syntrophorhabdaceae bacterium]
MIDIMKIAKLDDLSVLSADIAKQIAMTTNLINREKPTKFTDVQYMTAAEKANVLNKWRVFVNSSYKKENFTKSIYEHLCLHCGFIAHYNKSGFYSTYWYDPDPEGATPARFVDVEEFLHPHFNYYSEYKDLNTAMLFVLKEYLEKKQKEIEAEVMSIYEKDMLEVRKSYLDKLIAIDEEINRLRKRVVDLSNRRNDLDEQQVAEEITAKYRKMFPSLQFETFREAA